MTRLPEGRLLPPQGFEDRHFSDAWPMGDELGLAMIRLWCEALENANPLYYNADLARASGYGGIIAPGSMFFPLCMRPEWEPEGRAAPSLTEGLKKQLPDYPFAAALQTLEHYHRPLYPGERPMIYRWTGDPLPEAMTERGPGRVISRYTCMRDSAGREIASQYMKTLRFRQAAGTSHKPAPRVEKKVASQELKRRTPDQPALRWDDIGQGQALPPISIGVPLKRFVKWVAATRDYNEVHHDPEFARGTGTRDIYIGVHFYQGMMERYATDWAGVQARVIKLETRPFERSYPGDTIRLDGIVTGKARDPRGIVVELEIDCSNARDITHQGYLTVLIKDGS